MDQCSNENCRKLWYLLPLKLVGGKSNVYHYNHQRLQMMHCKALRSLTAEDYKWTIFGSERVLQ